MRRPLSLLLLVVLAGCTGRSRQAAPDNTAETPAQQHEAALRPDTLAKALQPFDPAPLPDSVERLLASERAMHGALVEQLGRVTPAEADSIYLAKRYLFTDTPAYDSLEPILFRLADRCSAWGEPLPGDSLLLEQLSASGIVIENIGEGEREPRTERYYYYRIFGPYLTPETALFAQLLADNDTLLSADAALQPSLGELYRRCLEWERFLAAYPHSVYRSRIQEQYTLYMENLLFCTFDNTPTFDWTWDDDRGCRRRQRIYDDTLDEIRALVRDEDTSRTQLIVRHYLDLLAAQDYYYSEALEQTISALYTLPEPTAAQQPPAEP